MSHAEQDPEREKLDRLSSLLRDERWTIETTETEGVDLVASRGNERYAFEVKSADGARHAVAVGRLAEALLQAAGTARHLDHTPIAVLVVRNVSRSLLDHLDRRVPRLMEGLAVPKAGWGVLAENGFVRLFVPGMAPIRREATTRRRRKPARLADPFSDRGQWVIKVLLAPLLSPDHLRGADGGRRPPDMPDRLDNAYQVAARAGVSVPTADRTVRWLRAHGFLDADSCALAPARARELLESWRSRHPGPRQATPCSWLLPTRSSTSRLESVVAALEREPSPATGPAASGRGRRGPRGRACVASFTACDRLKCGVVRGMPPRAYVEDAEDHYERLGLRPSLAGATPDVVILEPSFPESVFRGAVRQDALLVSDAVQCWLDMRHERARGDDQSLALEKGPLRAIFRPGPRRS